MSVGPVNNTPNSQDPVSAEGTGANMGVTPDCPSTEGLKNMPDTNEETGEITYSDYCFLKTPNKNFRYYPGVREIDIDGMIYALSSI